MVTKAGRLITSIFLCAAFLVAGCAHKQVAQIRALSDQEAADLWTRAETKEPVGKPVVRTVTDLDGVTTVSTTQSFMLRMKGGGSNGLATVCGYSCQPRPGSGPESCQTSGCMPSGNSCTPASCGNCAQTRPCRVESTFGTFGGTLFIQ